MLLTAAALALILIPFALFESQIEAWAAEVLTRETSRFVVAAAIAGLLASDLLLPVPSSLVNTAAGYLLGAAWGTLVCWVGMTAGALIGYAVGARPGKAVARRVVGEAEWDRVRGFQNRFGDWALIVSRAVPVLAEASVVFAAAAGMPLGRFLVWVGLANLGVAAVYASIGAYALSVNSFLWAFAGATALPALAMWAARRFSGRSRKA